MTIGVGGTTAAEELAGMAPMRGGAAPIADAERSERIGRVQALMRARGVQALWLDTSTSLSYFTGLRLAGSERVHGAVIPAEGEMAYVCPAFEEAKTRAMIRLGDDVRTWEEHEDPAALIIETVRGMGHERGTIAIDEMAPFFVFDGLRRSGNSFEFVSAAPLTSGCRMIKTAAEIALMQRAFDITLRVQAAAARILRAGITTEEVAAFVAAAHRRLGADGPLSFCIVLFGEPTAYPHGVPYPQTLQDGDMVLLDCGATVGGYQSDLTRSYVFGEPTERQRFVWETERRAQLAVFDAARVGAPCETLDAAARDVIAEAGFGPGYATPGLPHRTGHGIGLDVHERPYVVQGDATPLAPGMCVSVEPTICIYGEFGVRLEDHIWMAEDGPRWFTQPCPSVDDPFGARAP